MRQVGIRALQHNAPAVVADAAAGEIIEITDRGRSVARIVPLGGGRMEALRRAGLVTEPTMSREQLGPPLRSSVSLSRLVAEGRNDERY